MNISKPLFHEDNQGILIAILISGVVAISGAAAYICLLILSLVFNWLGIK